MLNLGELGDQELLAEIESALGSERTALARLVVYLGEVEQRRIHLVQGYASLFEFCTVQLRLSEGEAFRRINAARLARRFPVIVELLAAGDQHLSGLVLLRDHLTEDSHAELLAESSNKSKRQIEMLLAARAPKPDVESKIRKLPQKTPAPVAGAPDAPSADLPGLATGAPAPGRERARDKGRLEPLSADRFKVQLTASAELRDKLEHAANLMSHANPSRDLAVIVERAIDLLIDKLETSVLAKKKTKRTAKPKATNDPGTVPRAERRTVFERDGVQCTYVSPDGRRCTARAFLQVDHVEERARGGSGKSKNLRVRCQAHNLLEAERAFGREHVDRCIDFSRRKCRGQAATSEPQRSTAGKTVPGVGGDDELGDKLVRGLTGLGFTRRQALATLEALRSGRGPVPWSSPIEDLLRAAVQMLAT